MKKSNRANKLYQSICIIFILCLSVLCLSACGGSSSAIKKPFQNLFNGIKNENIENICAVYPEEAFVNFWENIDDYSYEDNVSGAYDIVKSQIPDNIEDFKLKIVETEDITDKSKSIIDKYEDVDIKVSEVDQVTICNENNPDYTEKFKVVKIDNKYYLDVAAFNFASLVANMDNFVTFLRHAV